MEIDVADAVAVREHRNPAFLLHPLDQRRAAARHDHVDEFRHGQHDADRRPVRGRHALQGGLGQPRPPQPLLQAAEDRARGEEALRAAAQDRRIARLEAERPGVRGDVRARFVNHADHAERHAHARDVEAVRALPARQLGADRVVEPGDRLEPGGHRLDAHRIQRQAVEQRCPQAALLRRRHVFGVGGQEFVLSVAQAVRCGAERPIFQRTRRGRQDARRGPGALSQLAHFGCEVLVGCEVLAQRGRHGGSTPSGCRAQFTPRPARWPSPRHGERPFGMAGDRLLAAAAGHGHEAAAEVPEEQSFPTTSAACGMGRASARR